jgi:hypothetical protein
LYEPAFVLERQTSGSMIFWHSEYVRLSALRSIVKT